MLSETRPDLRTTPSITSALAFCETFHSAFNTDKALLLDAVDPPRMAPLRGIVEC